MANHHSVYVLQLGTTGRVLYVGMTGLEPEERLRQHLNGTKSSQVCRRYVRQGQPITLRLDLPPHTDKLTFEQAVKMESSHAETLRRGGYIVYGGH